MVVAQQRSLCARASADSSILAVAVAARVDSLWRTLTDRAFGWAVVAPQHGPDNPSVNAPLFHESVPTPGPVASRRLASGARAAAPFSARGGPFWFAIPARPGGLGERERAISWATGPGGSTAE
jgi:hypothetical protein